MKKLIIPTVAALGLITSTMVMANPYGQTDNQVPNYQQQRHMHSGPNQFRKKNPEVRKIMQKYRAQIKPLRQQAKVLKMQIDGKMVTKGTQWSDLSAMTKQLGKLKGQIMLLKTQARFEIYQKTGILLKGGKHKHRFAQQRGSHR